MLSQSVTFTGLVADESELDHPRGMALARQLHAATSRCAPRRSPSNVTDPRELDAERVGSGALGIALSMENGTVLDMGRGTRGVADSHHEARDDLPARRLE
jgi:hypothetical protein